MRIEAGQTLTQSMKDMPDLFPPFYLLMIRAGEVGGILEITLGQVADMLQEDWTLSQMVGIPPMLMAKEEERTDWNTLPIPQRTLHLLLFCKTFGSMLSSGVPILQAMEVAGESLFAQQRNEVLAAREKVLEHGSIAEIVAQMPFLPPSAQALFSIGMEHGELDTLSLKAAELYRHQLVYQRQAG